MLRAVHPVEWSDFCEDFAAGRCLINWNRGWQDVARRHGMPRWTWVAPKHWATRQMLQDERFFHAIIDHGTDILYRAD
ncbi:MAG: hypothetical protein JJ920_02895 [Roseitalea sp.]|jgi:hypothetical protein|nr:hypothetical protein [Roseitalea sp.]MBO6723803.1 hypothetical protein [Roseitalea sp.]MBO6741831.1 hypothetical protein [Roseitalea sp.]